MADEHLRDVTEQVRGWADRVFHRLVPRIAATVDTWTDIDVELPARWRAKQVINVVNLTTPFGWAVAKAGRAHTAPGPRGLVLATGYRGRPRFGAFTMGNVIITGNGRGYLDNPALLRHEEIHSWQYVALGPLYAPCYGVACAISYLRTGNRGAANFFEQQAGLRIGGYPCIPPRSFTAGVRGLVGSARTTPARMVARFAPPPRHYTARSSAAQPA